MHPFRFGLQAEVAPTAQAFRELARRAEDLGFATLTVPDHLDAQWAPTPMLVAAAEATTTLRLGSLLWCNDYHHPAILAKEAATIDLLSDGRLELGLGAGWMTTDYEQAGIPLDPPGTRIDRLGEAITVIKGLLTGEPLTFRGEHYRITDLVGSPVPAQRPHPPIVVGGGGQRILSLAGREADIVALNAAMQAGKIDASAGRTATVEATREKLAWIRAAAGDRYDQIELQVRVHLAVRTDQRRELAEAAAASFGLTADQALASPHALAGSVDQMVEDLQARREDLGISYIGLPADAIGAVAPVVARLAGT